ncbi:cytochrome c3 family protein [Desulfurivibrio dismutans]|uniref:cytochrome c3 family protein n=1 Tax=Desulfurivibrio dismutans TaxID=1398908 RepID=UPI0023DB3BEF|nr:cytochrome c3 family protein [Desulfurivibrio alkaliphilus]MDF1613883.1 cytochrome c3 family protein [Desulfurivibrio alkaliphilus]
MKSWNPITLAVLVISAGLLLAACGGSSSAAKDDYDPPGTGVAPRLLSSDDHAGGLGWGRKDCLTCHPMERVEAMHAEMKGIADSLVRLADRVGGDVQRSCLACHDTNGLDPVQGRECLICHGNSGVMAGAGQFKKEHAHTITHIGGNALRDVDCVVCHERSNMDGTFDLNDDLTRFRAGVSYDSINDFCLTCHDFDGVSTPVGDIIPPPLRYPELPQAPVYTDLQRSFMGAGSTDAERRATADIHGFRSGTSQADKPVVSAGLPNVYRAGYEAGMVLSCTDCHFVHSSGNPYLITERADTAGELTDAAVLSSSVAVSERNFEQLCAVCHTHEQGGDVGNGLRGSLHFAGYVGDCVSCHYHGAGYIADLF